MLSKRWDTAGRWCIYALLLIVFVGPFWGIVATAFSGAPVKPGELLAWPHQFSLENFIFAWMDIGVWQYLLNSILVVFFGTVLQVSVSALAAYALARKKFRGVALVSLVILLLNGGHFAQPLDFTASPNPGYQSGLAMLSFVVFAIFAYGGIEAVGGLVDKTEQPEKNFAKGIVIAAVVISVGYSLAIVLWGVSANWQQVLSNPSTNLGNITYVLMTRLGATLANAMHLPPAVAALSGLWFARITGLAMFLAYTGAFFTLSYSPLKAIIQGTPKALWPSAMTRINANGMPANAMWWQCLLVSVFILLVSFGGDTASAFYNKLTLMANVSMTLPYLFLTLAFPFFKAKQDLDRPFVIFKHRGSTLLATAVVVLVVAFANIFTVIEPVMEAGDWSSALWMVGGPAFFSLLALGIYENYRRRTAVQLMVQES